MVHYPGFKARRLRAIRTHTNDSCPAFKLMLSTLEVADPQNGESGDGFLRRPYLRLVPPTRKVADLATQSRRLLPRTLDWPALEVSIHGSHHSVFHGLCGLTLIYF